MLPLHEGDLGTPCLHVNNHAGSHTLTHITVPFAKPAARAGCALTSVVLQSALQIITVTRHLKQLEFKTTGMLLAVQGNFNTSLQPKATQLQLASINTSSVRCFSGWSSFKFVYTVQGTLFSIFDQLSKTRLALAMKSIKVVCKYTTVACSAFLASIPMSILA